MRDQGQLDDRLVDERLGRGNPLGMERKPPRSDLSILSGPMREGRSVRVKPIGARQWRASDIYYSLIEMSWPRLAAAFVTIFVAFNLLFAALFWIDLEGIDWGGRAINAPPYWRAFFFSVDTVATIGYGNMVPISTYANALVVLEITLGILQFAIVTGIIFTRFSRPTARFLFSNVAVVQSLDGRPTLVFRAANQRLNFVFEATANVSLLANEQVGDLTLRRFRALKLERETNPVFALTWTIMHTIDESSPLAGWLQDRAVPDDAEIIVVLSGTDERTGQVMYGRWAYRGEDILWDVHFVDIIGQLPDGTRTIDYVRFHDTE